MSLLCLIMYYMVFIIKLNLNKKNVSFHLLLPCSYQTIRTWWVIRGKYYWRSLIYVNVIYYMYIIYIFHPNILKDFPIVVLMWRLLKLCHPFFNNEVKKLIDKLRFYLISSSLNSSVPIADPKVKVFFN